MKTHFVKSAFIFLSTVVTLTACNDARDAISPIGGTVSGTESTQTAGLGDFKTLQFDANLFRSKIDAYLKTQNLAGYGFSIIVNGQTQNPGNGGDGWARKAVDSPSLKHGGTIRNELASCSKFITALSVGRALEMAGLSLDDKIWPYVPTYMTPSTGFKNISFRQLLSHHSGVKNYGSQNDADNGHLTDMEHTIEDGIDGNTYDTYVYSNMGYALGRILVPYIIWKKVQKLSTAEIQAKEVNKAQLDYTLADCFLQFTQTNVFYKAGLSDWNQIGATYWGNNQPTLYYASTNAAETGASKTSDIRNLGPGGFDLSAQELAMVVTAARTNKIISSDLLAQFKAGYKKAQMGFDDAMAGKYGNYYWKNGGTDRAESVLVDFDGPQTNVQVAVVANSSNGTFNSPGWLKDAYDASWK